MNNQKVVCMTMKGPALDIIVDDSGFHIHIVGDVYDYLNNPAMTTEGVTAGDLCIEYLHELLDEMFIKPRVNWQEKMEQGFDA